MALVITIARKPCSETSGATNVLKWGTGGLNIRASRVQASAKDVEDARVPMAQFSKVRVDAHFLAFPEGRRGDLYDMSGGRWPANLVLQHKPGCRQIATDFWECEPDCPVAALDAQSGVSTSPSNPVTRGASPLFGIGDKGLGVGYGDTGGVSRFFKQVQKVKS